MSHYLSWDAGTSSGQMMRKFAVCTHPPSPTLPPQHADSHLQALVLVPQVFLLPTSRYLNITVPSSRVCVLPFPQEILFDYSSHMEFSLF